MVSTKGNPLTIDALAGEIDQGADDASGLPSKLARYSEARHRACLMQSFAQREGHVKEASKLRGCGEYLLFRDYFTVGKVRLHAASFCKKHLLCPLCAIRRGAKVLRSYLERFEAVQVERPDLKPYLVTLTVKNGSDLAERVGHLRNGVRTMFRQRRNAAAGLRAPVEFSKSEGGFHSFEVTNKGNGWHPHVHMVWLCSTPPCADALSAEWQAITGDSFVVDVRPFGDDHVSAFMEVCKYALKFSDLSLSDNWHAYEVMRGMRLVDCHGLFRGVEIPESLVDEPLDDLPYIEMLYRFVYGTGYTVCTVSAPQEPDKTRRVVKLVGAEYVQALRTSLAVQGVFYRRPKQHVIYSLWKPGNFSTCRLVNDNPVKLDPSGLPVGRA